MAGWRRFRIFWVTAFIGLAVFWVIGPILQDPAYHRFADVRACGPLPNCFNVLSNLAFLVVGIIGLRHLGDWPDPLRPTLAVFWWGVLLVASGSAWYHLAPDDVRLVWDRLPMTVAFMGLFAAVLIDRLEAKSWILPVLVTVGLTSIGVWVMTGDLRLYGLVQFLPMVLMVGVLFRHPHGEIPLQALIWALGWYIGAKLVEWLDSEILALTGVISGHSLKHLLAALATVRLWRPERYSS